MTTATEEYTPTTEQVRDGYVRAMRQAFIDSESGHAAEFDRWLSTIQAETWRRGYEGAVTAARSVGHWISTGYDMPIYQGQPHRTYPLGPQNGDANER